MGSLICRFVFNKYGVGPRYPWVSNSWILVICGDSGTNSPVIPKDDDWVWGESKVIHEFLTWEHRYPCIVQESTVLSKCIQHPFLIPSSTITWISSYADNYNSLLTVLPSSEKKPQSITHIRPEFLSSLIYDHPPLPLSVPAPLALLFCRSHQAQGLCTCSSFALDALPSDILMAHSLSPSLHSNLHWHANTSERLFLDCLVNH